MTYPYGDPRRGPGTPAWGNPPPVQNPHPQYPFLQPQYPQPQYPNPQFLYPQPNGGVPRGPRVGAPIAWIIGIVAAVVVVVAGAIVVPRLIDGGGIGGSSDEEQIVAQFEGYVEDLGAGDWSSAADRICRESPMRPIVQGLGLFSQTVGEGRTLDFGIDVHNVQINGDDATVQATFDFPGLENAPMPGAAKRVDGQWCLMT